MKKRDGFLITAAKKYKNSVTLNKLRNLYRWGFAQAERMIPNTGINQKVLFDFIEYWRKFTIYNNPKKWYDLDIKYFVFKVYKHKSVISWTCSIQNTCRKEYFKINSNNTFLIDYDDALSKEYELYNDGY